MFGTLVGDMQEDVVITAPTANANGTIAGKFYKQTESSALVDRWGEGYYLSLKFTSPNWSQYDSVKVGLVNSAGTGMQEILTDPDKNGVWFITSPSVQSFKIEATKGSETVTKIYDFVSGPNGAVGYESDGAGGWQVDTLWV